MLFDWDLGQFDRLVENCDFDDSLQLALPYLKRTGKILEAGCGPGHVVAYLLARGFEVEGVELNAQVVGSMAQLRPDLPLRVADVSNIRVPDGYYESVLSFGVIEHFRAGPSAALQEHHRILAENGIAMFSVPSLTAVRRLKRRWYFATASFRPSLNPLVRRIAHRPPVRHNRRDRDGFQFDVNPVRGDFFEYIFRPAEFEALVKSAGFEILESRPTHHAVGLWSEFGEWAVRNDRRRFVPTPTGRTLHAALSLRPFLHNHMHTIIARKAPVAS